MGLSRQNSARTGQVKAFDHFAIHGDDALAGIVCLERRDNALCPVDVVRCRGEGGIGRGHLGRVNQGFAVEAECPALTRFAVKAIRVGIGVEDAVQYGDVRGPSRCDDLREMRDESKALRAAAQLQGLAQGCCPVRPRARRADPVPP